jgi:hypothetical protein
MKLLELAGFGTDCLAGAAAAWYAGARFADRVRDRADRQLAMHSGPAAGIGALSPRPADDHDDADDETGAEELLAARAVRFGDPYTDRVVGWGEWIWGSLGVLGWARIPLFIPAGLALWVLLAPWYALKLPFLVVRFLLDRDNDFRLRTIVLALALGLCLQIADALAG